jgi:hypothetical protein
MTFAVEQALTVPSALTVRRQNACTGARDSSSADYRDVVTEAIGSTFAERAQAEAAWPAVEAALRRAHQASHDPATVLSIVTRSRDLRVARTVSQTLAWRIGRYLTDHPDPVADMNSPADPDTWRALAWTLKATEADGTPAEAVVSAARQVHHLADLLAVAQRAARQHGTDTGEPELPWLRRLLKPADRTADAGLDGYLGEAATLISARVRYLTGQAERDLPAWLRLLGQPPAGDCRREQWRHHVGVIAAYRDQHQITSDDPHQVLGPYPEPGHAGHTAYWHAVESIHAARQFAGLDPAATNGVPDPARVQVAADIYLALPETERGQIRTTIVTRLGPLWFGSQKETGDHAVTRTVYAHHLTAALAERSHLTLPARHLDSRASEAPVEIKQGTRNPQQRIHHHAAPQDQATALQPYGPSKPRQAPEQQTAISKVAQSPQ